MSIEQLWGLIPYLTIPATILLVVLGLFVTHRFILRAHTASTGKKFRNQMIMLGLSAAGALLIIMVLPIGDEKRGQILSLIGIVVSAGIALSSTTLLGNAMAGLMIRAVRAFRLGEFIEVDGHFGRVSDMGLFHTEIQTEDRDLKTLPNVLLVTNAVKRIRPSGTILSAQVSLGYDLSPNRIQRLLVQAAQEIGLKDPFARIVDLGDNSITYRVAGLLQDVSQLLIKRSELRVAMIQTLHADGVEIVSPQFRNTRMIDPQRSFIAPLQEVRTGATAEPNSEIVVFDKAEEAASLDSLRTAHSDLEREKEALQKARKDQTGPELEKTDAEIERLEKRLARLLKVIVARENRAAEKE